MILAVPGKKIECPACHKKYYPVLLSTPEGRAKFDLLGTHTVQDVYPKATTIQREQLMTGICSDECWNNFLGSPDDEYEDPYEGRPDLAEAP